MERQLQHTNYRRRFVAYYFVLICLPFFALTLACSEDGKNNRNATSGSEVAAEIPVPETVDAKQLCFETKRQAEVDAGRTPDNIAIYQECGFFKGEFSWRQQYDACKKSGKVWDGEARTCSTVDMDSEPCTYDYIEQKWASKYTNFAEQIVPIKAAGYEADQCGTTAENTPYLVFVKYDVKTVTGGGIDEQILYKYVGAEKP